MPRQSGQQRAQSQAQARENMKKFGPPRVARDRQGRAIRPTSLEERDGGGLRDFGPDYKSQELDLAAKAELSTPTRPGLDNGDELSRPTGGVNQDALNSFADRLSASDQPGYNIQFRNG